MATKWSQNGDKMAIKCRKNGGKWNKMAKKWRQNDDKIAIKWRKKWQKKWR